MNRRGGYGHYSKNYVPKSNWGNNNHHNQQQQQQRTTNDGIEIIYTDSNSRGYRGGNRRGYNNRRHYDSYQGNNNNNQQYGGYNKYNRNNQQSKQDKYEEVEIEYAPREVYEQAKGKGKTKVIMKELTDNDVVYNDDLLDDYHGGDSKITKADLEEAFIDEDDDDTNIDDNNYDKYYYDEDDTIHSSSDTKSKMSVATSSSSSQQSYNPYDKRNYSNPLVFTNVSGFTEKVDAMIKNKSYYNHNITDSFVNVLMIAEKPSIAKMISEVLSNGNAKPKKTGRGKVLITFDGYFKGVKARFTVSAVAGHVYTSDFLREHNKWDAIDAYELYDVPIVKLDAMRSMRMPDTMKKLGQGKDIICLWLDCDKEGENICYEVLYNVLPVMNKKNYQQIYRAKFSSLTKKDLKYAFDNISSMPNKNESLSVDCRQVIDLKIGVSFTRFLTSSILPGLDIPQQQQHGNSNNKTILSYGPCQTPCLWFCVNRQKEMLTFKPQEYYKPYIELEINSMIYKIKYPHRIYSKTELGEVMSKLSNVKTATVKDVKSSVSSKLSPVGLNTVNLLRIASSYLKISPHSTMAIAEKLYTMGYITYPRTETTRYANSFDFIGSIKSFENHPVFGKNVKSLLSNFKKPIPKGTDVGDHPPITPSRSATPDQLQGDAWRLYEVICVNFFASISRNVEYEDNNYTIDINGVTFEESSINIKDEGYLLFLPHQRKNFIKDFPVVKKGSELTIKGANYDKKWTEPPDYLTESDLIKEMEVNKIGTDASMPVHIENICQRGYVKVDENRRLIPTKLGKALIEALGEVDPEIIHPDNRAKIEGFVDEVAHGKKSYQEVLKYALELYKEKYLTIRVNYDKLLAAFDKYFNVDTSKLGNAYKSVKQQNEKYKSDKFVQKKESEVTTDIGKCDKCAKGKMYIEYDTFDKYCIFCTNCKRRTKIIRDAIKIDVKKEQICDKCNCCYITVKVEDPFLDGSTTYTGCLMCDPKLS